MRTMFSRGVEIFRQYGVWRYYSMTRHQARPGVHLRSRHTWLLSTCDAALGTKGTARPDMVQGKLFMCHRRFPPDLSSSNRTGRLDLPGSAFVPYLLPL